jgi:cytochrome c6
MKQLKYIIQRLKPIAANTLALNILILMFPTPKGVEKMDNVEAIVYRTGNDLVTGDYKVMGGEGRFKPGEIMFRRNCMACHIGGNNLILPEKNLRKQALETNGMDNVEAIMYQVTNGKNGMPAFGGRFTEEQVETVSRYVLEEFGQRFEVHGRQTTTNDE